MATMFPIPAASGGPGEVYVAAVLAAAGLLLFAAGLARMLRQRALDQSIRRLVAAPSPPPEPAGDDALLVRQDGASRLSRRVAISRLGAELQSRLSRAGIETSPARFLTLQAAAAAGAGLLAALATPGAAPGVRTLAALGAAGGGLGAPLLLLGRWEQRRLLALERQLPQAIDSMAGTLQAGSSLPQAMATIAREMPPPLSTEFRRVVREMELGVSLTDALGTLQERVRSQDLLLLSSAIAIQQRVGGDLAGVFRNISFTIRERLRIRNEIKVLTAQGRYSAYLITAMPVVIFGFLWVTSHDYAVQLLQPGFTRLLLVGGIAGLVVGYAAMQKIVSIDV